MRKQYHLSRKAHTIRPRRGWAPLDDLRIWVSVGNLALIGLDLPLTTLVDVTRWRRNILTCTHAYKNNKSKSLSDYAQQDLSVMTRGTRNLGMHMPQSSTDSCLLAAITNHLLNMIISQVMLIDRNRLATYANHAIITHAVYDITFFHDYKIVNVTQVCTMQPITTSDVLRLNTVNKPSSISENVAEIWINSQTCKGNNLTTRYI
jgi:hypothetical protein